MSGGPVLVAAGAEYGDGAGVALSVAQLRHRRDGAIEVANLTPRYVALLQQFVPQLLAHDLDPAPSRGRPSERSAAKPTASGTT